ncbi:alpha/beta hydrolase-fold protein [Corynebacterium pseudodiphtheriticum]|uniref:alpha/beta hydrolase-fold protein n=1 Tax=Corynebacterium pseudodiphtheriticum TaxID=37637 RepID=UPI00254E0974|nr:alpha/beta hydrolase-fold protein [Corynebacterium pseudodiphtheriticum]MDK8701276.1 alpha/beta hydrolase-fold protein [Corynebacterium pseudodiphtheriticum]
MNVLPGNEDQLRQELIPAVGDPAALQQAWERIAAGGFPRRSTDGQSYVFAVRYSELQAMTTQSLPTLAEQRKSGVHLHINRLTDKLKYELGMMNHLPGTDIWTLTVEVSQHYQGSYGVQLTHGQRTPAMCDPHAIRTLWNEDGFGLSEVSQPLAVSNTAMQVRKTHCAGVDVLVYLPGKGSRAGLLTLFDGEKWCKTNLHACISAINEEAELPLAAVLICNDSNSQRVQRLGLDADFLAAVCTQVQDHVVKLMGELGVEFIPEQSILAGQSLGGLGALYIAQNHPNAFRELIVQSPSLWWKPNKTAVPTDNNLQNSSWITEQFSRQPAMPRLHIDVGAREDVGVAKAHLLARKLSDCGWPHQLEVYEGGHDHVAWRAQLVAHLREIAIA